MKSNEEKVSEVRVGQLVRAMWDCMEQLVGSGFGVYAGQVTAQFLQRDVDGVIMPQQSATLVEAVDTLAKFGPDYDDWCEDWSSILDHVQWWNPTDGDTYALTVIEGTVYIVNESAILRAEHRFSHAERDAAVDYIYG